MKNLSQKSMFLLVETIRIEDGKPVNMSFHNERLNRSVQDLFGKDASFCLDDIVKVPSEARSGIYKCRVEYNYSFRTIEFIPYKRKIIRSLKLVEDNSINYSYKYADRKRIEELFCQRKEFDDILIIKNGMVTDSSYANVIFRDQSGNWFTPSSCLLAGTRRANLLLRGLITETSITINDIGKYKEVKLINAMLDIEDSEAIPVSKISRDF